MPLTVDPTSLQLAHVMGRDIQAGVGHQVLQHDGRVKKVAIGCGGGVAEFDVAGDILGGQVRAGRAG